MERTLAIIKPDAVGRRLVGRIVARIEAAGFEILAPAHGAARPRRRPRASTPCTAGSRSSTALTDFMSSGPVVLMVLESPDAIREWRDLMGATDPAKAAEGTLRREFGTSIGANATHGSDAPETAAFEIGYFFRGMELV